MIIGARRSPGQNRGRPNSAPRATETPSLLNIAWSAGVYEGEGTCQPIDGRFGKSQTVKIQQNDRSVLERMQRWFGGSISTNMSRGFKPKPIYIWIVCGARARGFLYTIFSFLTPRRRLQARAAMGV